MYFKSSDSPRYHIYHKSVTHNSKYDTAGFQHVEEDKPTFEIEFLCLLEKRSCI